MATVTEVVDRAANDLGILRLGQTLQAQDSTRITEAYNEVYATLVNEGLATWASTAEVPDELVPHVVALMADNCINVYGLSKERYQRIKGASIPALREIRRLTAPIYVSQDSAANY